jgi:hypothetical protein
MNVENKNRSDLGKVYCEVVGDLRAWERGKTPTVSSDAVVGAAAVKLLVLGSSYWRSHVRAVRG